MDRRLRRHLAYLQGSRADRSLWCWGDGVAGQAGQAPYPALVGTARDWTSVSVGLYHACAIRSDRSLWCWGGNDFGQLGTGGATGALAALTRVGRARDWTTVSAGGAHTCATRAGRGLWCWGSNFAGQLGDGTVIQRDQPVRVGAEPTWTGVATSMVMVMVPMDDEPSEQTGRSCGICGDGTTTSSGTRPVPGRVGTDATWAQVSVGRPHACAVRPRTLWCWGLNDYGQLGDGSSVDRRTPVRVGTDANWASVTTGDGFTCAVRTTHTLWCWGRNDYGQLGDGTDTNRRAPHRVGTAANWASVSAGPSGACAVRTTHTVWCWGRGISDWYRDGTTNRVLTAMVRIGTDADWASVSSAGTSACGIRRDRSLWCWPTDGSPADRVPARVGAEADWASVAVGSDHTCAVRVTHTLWCWGRNDVGQLGDGTTRSRPAPLRVGTDANWAGVSVGNDRTCAVRTTLHPGAGAARVPAVCSGSVTGRAVAPPGGSGPPRTGRPLPLP